MSNSARLGIVALAVVLAVAAFFVFRPADTSRQQQRPQTESAGESAAERRSAPGASTEASPAPPRTERIRLAGGKPVGGVRTLTFDSGEPVRLAFSSDAPAEVHIHGYDRTVEVVPGRTARVSFPAKLEGVYEIEEHDSDALLAKLAVRP
jgi:hypothetical protein